MHPNFYPPSRPPRVFPELRRARARQLRLLSLMQNISPAQWMAACGARAAGGGTPASSFWKDGLQDAARALGLELIVLNATKDEEIDQADAE